MTTTAATVIENSEVYTLALSEIPSLVFPNAYAFRHGNADPVKSKAIVDALIADILSLSKDQTVTCEFFFFNSNYFHITLSRSYAFMTPNRQFTINYSYPEDWSMDQIICSIIDENIKDDEVPDACYELEKTFSFFHNVDLVDKALSLNGSLSDYCLRAPFPYGVYSVGVKDHFMDYEVVKGHHSISSINLKLTKGDLEIQIGYKTIEITYEEAVFTLKPESSSCSARMSALIANFIKSVSL